MRRVLCGAALVAALVGLAGCGGDGPKVVPVSGVVTIDGAPLAYGHIQVVPTGWRPASSPIGPDGKFTLTTTVSGDGVAVGTHLVLVMASESLNPETTKWHAPKKYADPATSNLTATVTGPTTDLKVELKWDKGAKPFVEKFGKEGGSENAVSE